VLDHTKSDRKPVGPKDDITRVGVCNSNEDKATDGLCE